MARFAFIRCFAIAVCACALLPQAPQAQTTCRANAIGTATCSGPDPAPEPRPAKRPKGLEAARSEGGVSADKQNLIPARRVNRLGSAPRSSGGFCRTDALGNLRCR